MKFTFKKALITLFFITLLCLNFSAEKVSAQAEPPFAPANLTTTINSSSQSVTLNWQYDLSLFPSADGFIISRATSINGEYSFVNEVFTSQFVTDYTCTDYISTGVTYYYKVTAYVVDYETYTTIYGPDAISEVVQIPLSTPVLKSVTAIWDKSAEINWASVPNASGYYIYRSTKPNTGFTLIKTFTPDMSVNSSWNYESYFDNSLTFVDTKLTVGKTYYYKICPYVTYGSESFGGLFSNIKSAIIRMNAVTVKTAYSKKKATNTLTWKKMSNADGYVIYVSKKYDGKYKKLKTIKKNKTCKFTHNKLKNGTAYYYKVYSFKNFNKKPLLSVEPYPFMKYCDYYSYENEEYYSRFQRIFGKKGTGRYKNSAQARKHMKTIRIKVWDINSSGKKYTRTFSVSVHKNIAPSVKQMFKEIYKSKEKFPIHDIGCFSWRGDSSESEHCLGLAFDINASENYMIQGKKVLSGSCWSPKKNKYSIPLKCDLVKILAKYGFRRGFWGDTKDYMHFSYLGT